VRRICLAAAATACLWRQVGVGSVKITYTISGREGWQVSYFGADITAVRPAGKVQPTSCPY
jgi:hypothetical protein